MVQTVDDQLVLIDWDTAGTGPAVLDLGDVLLGCHIPLAAPYSSHLQPDQARIQAVVDGYRSKGYERSARPRHKCHGSPFSRARTAPSKRLPARATGTCTLAGRGSAW